MNLLRELKKLGSDQVLLRAIKISQRVYMKAEQNYQSMWRLAHILNYWLFGKDFVFDLDSKSELSMGKLSFHEPEFMSSKNEDHLNKNPKVENLSDDE